LKLLKAIQQRLSNYTPGTAVTIQEYQDGKPYGTPTTSDGYNITTEYVNLEAPNYLVETEKVFYKVEKDGKKSFHFVRLWKMINLKPPAKEV